MFPPPPLIFLFVRCPPPSVLRQQRTFGRGKACLGNGALPPSKLKFEVVMNLQTPPPSLPSTTDSPNHRNMHLFFFMCQGETLGEVKAGEEEVVSASDWVNRSRKKAVAMEEERLLAKQRERYICPDVCTKYTGITAPSVGRLPRLPRWGFGGYRRSRTDAYTWGSILVEVSHTKKWDVFSRNTYPRGGGERLLRSLRVVKTDFDRHERK